MEEANLYELALGTKSRSGDQFDIWEAVYSPVDVDGYPARIFDKETGIINKTVAQFWKENYDLSHIIARDWNDPMKKLGEKLTGKIRVFTGTADSFFLDGGVRLFEERMKELKNPEWNGVVKYGIDKEGIGFDHCW
jgi:hypothetical protein